MGQADLVQDNLGGHWGFCKHPQSPTMKWYLWLQSNIHWDRVCNLACCRESKSGPMCCKTWNHLFHLSGSSLAQLFNETNPIYFSKSCKTLGISSWNKVKTQQTFIAVPVLLGTWSKALLSPAFHSGSWPTGLRGTQGQRGVRNWLANLPCRPVPSHGPHALNSFIHPLTHSRVDIITGAHQRLQRSSLSEPTPREFRHSHVPCFEQWNVSRREVCGFWVEQFKGQSILHPLFFPTANPKAVIYSDSSVSLDPWVILMSYYNPHFDPR